MENQKKIIKEIEAVGLKIEAKLDGFHVYPIESDDSCIWSTKLAKLISIAQKYGLGHYINFELGYIRLH